LPGKVRSAKELFYFANCKKKGCKITEIILLMLFFDQHCRVTFPKKSPNRSASVYTWETSVLWFSSRPLVNLSIYFPGRRQIGCSRYWNKSSRIAITHSVSARFRTDDGAYWGFNFHHPRRGI
jgi:hypothetical protein